jgi:hypothetical protein
MLAREKLQTVRAALIRQYKILAFSFLLSCPVLAETAPPAVVSRAEWGAAAPRKEVMRQQQPLEIVIHHTGEPQRASLSLDVKLRNLQSFSLRPGKVGSHSKPAWGDVPYHYYIDLMGHIGEGRDIGFAGDTNTSYDTMNKIQIVVEGNFENEHPSQEQLTSLKQLVLWLKEKYKIGSEKIGGHSDHAKTDCPGKYLKSFVAGLKTGTDKN